MGTDGHAVTDRAFRGRHVLVHSGSMACPGLCRLILCDEAVALGRAGPRAGRVQPVPDRLANQVGGHLS